MQARWHNILRWCGFPVLIAGNAFCQANPATITNADLVANQFTASIYYAGIPPGSPSDGNWLMTFAGTNPPELEGTNCSGYKTCSQVYAFDQPYNYTFPTGPSTFWLPRQKILRGYYLNLMAYWQVEPGGHIAIYKLPHPWNVLGLTRHSIYSVRDENICKQYNPGSASAWVAMAVRASAGSACTGVNYSQTTMNAVFQQQTTLNGTGRRSNGQFVKPMIVTAVQNCPNPFSNLPAGAVDSKGTTNNVFVTVGSVTGTCNTVMSETSVAVGPLKGHYQTGEVKQPQDGKCGDNILAVDSNNANIFSNTKVVADRCPACEVAANNNGAMDHVDNFSTAGTCLGAPGGNVDEAFSPAWTANTEEDAQ